VSLESELRASGQPFEDVVQGQASLLWAHWVGPLQQDKVGAITFEPARAAADATSPVARLESEPCSLDSTTVVLGATASWSSRFGPAAT
jgi:hypothetical protein